MILGLLLARAGVNVTVLEKHADFFRDFRGDTLHPSTLQIMNDMGLLEGLLHVPHAQLRALSATIGPRTIRIADFGGIPGPCKFIAFMPQWDFLNYLAQQARAYPHFELQMQTQATDLLWNEGRVAGVRAQSLQGSESIAADLVVACDGRHSTMRERAKLTVQDIGAPFDVLWMRLSKDPGSAEQALGNVVPGGILVAIDRGDYYQCAFVIRKGGYQALIQRGIEAFRQDVAAVAPFLKDRVAELRDWNQIKLLTVVVDRLRTWYLPGLLCIGDAAHAMSPIGGVGINLAVQDAVAAANILAGKLRRGCATTEDLAAVQRRRELPARLTQRLQVQLQNRALAGVLSARAPIAVPAVLRLLDRSVALRRGAAYVIGLGFRRERVRTKTAAGAD